MQRTEVLEELSKYALSAKETGELTSFAAPSKRPQISGPGLESAPPVAKPAVGGYGLSTPACPYDQLENNNGIERDFDSEAQLKPSVSSTPTNNESEGESAEKKACEELETVNGNISNANCTKAAHPKKNLAKGVLEKGSGKEVAKAVNVAVERRADIQAARLKLPILGEEQRIVEMINDNPVVLIAGETGSGKTTQVPQFLYEAGYAEDGGLIGVTEPRRVAAISMSERIGLELGLSSDVVSYQIRYQGNVTEKTKIKLMTDGVLMKEVQRDIRLSRYSVIIIDEAHERSMYSDILLGLLSRIVRLRAKSGERPLKLVIMSATLRVDDFTSPRLFPSPPPLIKVESRQYPVTVHFLRRTPQLYLEAAYRKVVRIHRELPSGGILVFVSGQREVHNLIRWLRKTFPPDCAHNAYGENDPLPRKRRRKIRHIADVPDINLDDYDYRKLTGGTPVDLDGEDAVEEVEALMDEEDDMDSEAVDMAGGAGGEPLHCLPLYSLLPPGEQHRVFEPVPPGRRLCVVATNVAETSLTIPGIRYVVDCGKEKVRRYDPITGLSEFVVQWLSQASAEQRSGRAGRVGPGHCYRLYSSAVFSDFAKQPPSEILSKPVEELVLQMKAMAILKVPNFPFPTPPDADALQAAEENLIKLGALVSSPKDGLSRVTSLGRTMSLFPLRAGFAKLLALSEQAGCLPYAVCIVAALSVREPLHNLSSLPKEQILQQVKIRRRWAESGQRRLLGDAGVLLSAVGAAEWAALAPAFCDAHGLRRKAMLEIRQLRRQLTNLLNANCQLKKALVLDPKLEPPSEAGSLALRQLLLSGLPNNVARRLHRDADGKILKAAYQTMLMEETAFLNPASVLYKDEPEWLLYQDLTKSTEKTLLHCATALDPEWLPRLAEGYCSFERLPDGDGPVYDPERDEVVVEMRAFYGARRWELSNVRRAADKDLDAFRSFAKSLLAGDVFPKLAEWRPLLLATPATILKSWSHLHERNEALLGALVDGEVLSRRSAEVRWSSEPSWLLKEFLLWLPASLHARIQQSWPPTT